MPGFSKGIGPCFGGGGMVYNPKSSQDIAFFSSGRSGLTMTDQIGTNHVSIFPSYLSIRNLCYAYYADNAAISPGSGNMTLACWVYQTTKNGTRTIWGKQNGAAVAGGFDIATTANGYAMARLKTDNNTYTLYSITGTTDLTDGWHFILMEIQQSPSKVLRLYVDNVQVGSDTAFLGTIPDLASTYEFCLNCSNKSDGSGFENTSVASYADCYVYPSILSAAQKTTLFNRGTVTGASIHLPCARSGYGIPDASGNNRHFIGSSIVLTDYKYGVYGSRHLLNVGYRGYHKVSTDRTFSFSEEAYFQVPYNDDGSVNSSLDSTYSAYPVYEDHPGDSQYHNLADSKLVIPLWDRSNATIYRDNARVAYAQNEGTWYDSSNPTHWHITEIARGKMWMQTNANNRDTNFCKFSDRSYTYAERKLLKELFSYSSDQAANRTKILQYTGDTPQKGGMHVKIDDITNIATMQYVDGICDDYGMKFNFAINAVDVPTVSAQAAAILALVARGHCLHNHTKDHVAWNTYFETHTAQEFYDEQIVPARANLLAALGIDVIYFAYANGRGFDEDLNVLLRNSGHLAIVPYSNYVEPYSAMAYNASSELMIGSVPHDDMTKSYLIYARDNHVALGYTLHAITTELGKTQFKYWLEWVVRNGLSFYTSDQLTTAFPS